jgi:hypothetical protein
VGEAKTLSQKIGLTRGKAILVGALSVALVAVVYWRFGGAGDDPTLAVAPVATDVPPSLAVSSPMPSVEQAAAEVTATTARLAVTAAFDQAKWKPPELASVVAYDPFALPRAFPQPPTITGDGELAAEGGVASAEAGAEAAARLADAIETLQMELAALQARGVNVIVRGRNEYVAMIGDRTLHVGEEIEGFTITAIEPDGVRVERKIQE